MIDPRYSVILTVEEVKILFEVTGLADIKQTKEFVRKLQKIPGAVQLITDLRDRIKEENPFIEA